MVVARVSWRYLIFWSTMGLILACASWLVCYELTRINLLIVFATMFVGIEVTSAILVFLNGKWAIDDKFLYKGWRLVPFVETRDIKHIQIGLPHSGDSWANPLGAHLKKRAVLISLTDNRWLVWNFCGVTNRQQFIDAMLRVTSRDNGVGIPNDVLRKLSRAQPGRIVRC